MQSTTYFNYLGLGMPISSPTSNTYWGNGQSSTLTGSGTDDTFYVWSQSDNIVETPGAMATDIADIDNSYEYILPANVVNLTISGRVSTAIGNTLSDLIIAQGSNNLTIDGQGGNDVVVCNTGADTIVEDPGYGHQVVYNFNVAADSVRLANFGTTSFASLQQDMAQVGQDVVITLNNQDSVILRNTNVSQLSANNFELSLDLSAKQLTFDDEFNTFSSSPDGSTGTWMTTFPYSGFDARNNGGIEYYSDSSVGVNPFSDSNGVLSITAAPATPGQQTPAGSGLTYTSGLITTYKSFSQLYGYFEVRAEMPTGSGFWPAFWLLPADNAWPPELDVVEMYGSSPNTALQTAHTDVGRFNTQTSFNTWVPNASTSFNTYGVDWEKNTITWYVNGTAVASMATPADMDTPMYMLLNLGVGGAGSPAGTANGSTASMEIDYVRAYASGASVENVSASQFVSEGSLLNGTPFGITDTVANITSNLAAIAADAANIGYVTATNGAIAVSAATFEADQPALDLVSGGFEIFDTAANIEASIDQLADPHLTEIVDLSNVPIVVTTAQLKDDLNTLSKIVTPSGSVATINVSDTASNVATFLATYPASSTLGSAAASFRIVDTQANETSNLNRLNDPRITNIVDTTNHPVVASVAQITQDASALSKLSYQNGAPYQITVTDTAANIEGGFATLAGNSHISQINVTSGAFSAADVVNWASTLNKIQGGFVVADTAANIAADIVPLASEVWYIQSVQVTDNATPTVSVYNFSWYHDILDKTVGGFAVSDKAPIIAGNIASLETDIAHITSVSSTNGPPAVSVAIFSAYENVLDIIKGGFAISDSATNVFADVSAIEADPNVTSITLSGSASSVVLSVAQETSDEGLLSKVVLPNGSTPSVTVSDTAANIASTLASSTLGALPVNFNVVDTAANISATLDALSDPRVTSIVDTTNQPIVATVAQVTQDASAFARLQYQNGASYQIAIVDTAANIQSAIGTLASNWRVSSITASSGVPTVSVSQLSSAANALYKIVGSFDVADTAVNIASNLSTLEAFPHIQAIQATDGNAPTVSDAAFDQYQGVLNLITGGFAVSDTAATIAYDSTALANDVAHITSLTATSGVVTISVTRFVTYQSLFNKVTGGFALSDTVANVFANLGAIEADAANVTSITLSGSSSSAVLTVAQAQGYAGALAKIVLPRGSTPSITISDTAANIASALASSTLGALPVNFDVVDTAANISANLNALSDPRVTSIVDTTNLPIVAAVAQVTQDASAFAKLQYQNGASYQIAIVDTAANIQSAIGALASNWHVSSITASSGIPTVSVSQLSSAANALYKIVGSFDVADTAANIVSNLSTLQAFPHIQAIQATDGNAPTVSDATFDQYKGVLNLITGGFVVADTGAAIAYDATTLSADIAHITSLTATSGVVTISAARFMSYQGLFDKVTGGFAISDSAANIVANLAAIQADAANVQTISFTNSSPPVVSLSSAQAASDTAALSKITSPYTLAVTNTNGSTSLTSYGAVPSLTALGGRETLTGVACETLTFNAGFGQAELTNFASYISGSGNETISLPSAEFSNFAAVIAGGQSSGSGTIITAANGDALTLDNVSLAMLSSASGDFKFHS